MNMGAFPSGQWGQTVNLLLNASVVRIHQLPPKSCGKNVPQLFLLYRQKMTSSSAPFFKRFLQCCPTHKEENHKCALKN